MLKFYLRTVIGGENCVYTIAFVGKSCITERKAVKGQIK